jgi:hypothetical protein
MNTLRTLALMSLGALALACSGGGDESSPPASAPVPAEERPAPVKIGPPTNDGPGFLTAFADVNEVVGSVPHEVKLAVDVVEGTGNPPFSYKWDFGDATEFSTERTPSHVYKIPGSFRASVIVTDSKGDTDQDYVDITVNEDFEYTVTPDQLREALPMDEFVERAAQQGRQQKAAGAPGDQGGAPAPAGEAPPPGAPR